MEKKFENNCLDDDQSNNINNLLFKISNSNEFKSIINNVNKDMLLLDEAGRNISYSDSKNKSNIKINSENIANHLNDINNTLNKILEAIKAK